MIYVILFTTFLTLYLCFYLVLGTVFKSSSMIRVRLDRVAKEDVSKLADGELSQPLFIRVVRPLLDDISRTVLKVTPKEIVGAFEKKVIMAGNPYNLSVKDWINIQVVVIVCLPLFTTAIGLYSEFETRTILFLILIEILLGLLLPNLILNKQMNDRQKKIRNSMPDVLDLLTVSVEAGLGFDGALAKVIDKMPGPLADEFEKALQEIKVGKQKKDALKSMADRVNIHDLTTFVGAIIQAEQLGVSIGNVLRLQSEQMRQKRRQRAQEKALKAPVKMLIPMVLFIFPTIFSVLIGPVIIKAIDMFTK